MELLVGGEVVAQLKTSVGVIAHNITHAV